MTWGFAVFGERVPLDPWLIGGVVGAAGIVAGTVVLSRVESAVTGGDGSPPADDPGATRGPGR